MHVVSGHLLLPQENFEVVGLKVVEQLRYLDYINQTILVTLYLVQHCKQVLGK
jgi:hypothetical protein